jgi:Family of unknown function (DUF6502)
MSHSVAQPSPASAPGATTPPSPENVLNALRVLIRPLVRLAIKAGVKYADLDDLIRSALVAEAKAQCQESERANGSKLSMMTGLHRKEISSRLASPTATLPTENVEHSAARRVFARWSHLVRRKKIQTDLPIVARQKKEKSFGALSRSIVSDVHPRSVLDELKRLGLVTEDADHVTIHALDFSNRSSGAEKLVVATDNVHAHLKTMIDNVLSARPNQLERAVWVANIHRIDAERIAELAASAWQKTKDALYEAMRRAPEIEEESDAPRYQIRIGTYVHFDEQDISAKDNP